MSQEKSIAVVSPLYVRYLNRRIDFLDNLRDLRKVVLEKQNEQQSIACPMCYDERFKIIRNSDNTLFPACEYCDSKGRVARVTFREFDITEIVKLAG